MDFMGYKREDGRFGVRNHVLVLSSVSCANGVVEAISRALPDVVPVTHAYGCGYGPEDINVSLKTLTGLVNNPNIGAALVVGLGCEVLKPDFFVEAACDKPVKTLVIQEDGGSAATTEKGIDICRNFLTQLEMQKREPVPLSELVVGLECGGSDAFSGITANPATGAAADRFVANGATAILSETTEMIGTAHILKRRCVSQNIGDQVEKLVNDHEKHVKASLGELAGMVISPGNMDGGLSSITEKSLGCITKGGSTPITEVLTYADRPTQKGLVIMDTPGYDIDSMAGMAAGGAQIIIFTTGRGSIAGFPGVPVIKVSSNSKTYLSMQGDMDINAGTIIDDETSVDEVGQALFDLAIRVANGDTTFAESQKNSVFNYLKQGPTF
jgi:altronate dehydratase large subunit